MSNPDPRKAPRRNEPKPQGANVKTRACIRKGRHCTKTFQSSGPHHRMCEPCRTDTAGLPHQWDYCQ